MHTGVVISSEKLIFPRCQRGAKKKQFAIESENDDPRTNNYYTN